MSSSIGTATWRSQSPRKPPVAASTAITFPRLSARRSRARQAVTLYVGNRCYDEIAGWKIQRQLSHGIVPGQGAQLSELVQDVDAAVKMHRGFTCQIGSRRVSRLSGRSLDQVGGTRPAKHQGRQGQYGA